MNELNAIVVGFIAGSITGLSSILTGGFTMFFTAKAGHKNSTKHATAISLVVLLYLALMVLCLSLLVSLFIDALSIDTLQAFSIAMPILGSIAGLVLIRRYFWHSPLIAIKHHVLYSKKQIKRQHLLAQPLLTASALLYAASPIILINIILIGLLAVLSGVSALYWSVAYTIGLLTPLYVMTAMLANNVKVAKLLHWQDSTKCTSFLYIGLWCVFLAWLVLYYVIVSEFV